MRQRTGYILHDIKAILSVLIYLGFGSRHRECSWVFDVSIASASIQVDGWCLINIMLPASPYHRHFPADVMALSIPSIVKSLNSDSQATEGFVVSIYIRGNIFGPM